MAIEAAGHFEAPDWSLRVEPADAGTREFMANSIIINKTWADKEVYWKTPDAVAACSKTSSPEARIKGSLFTLRDHLNRFLAANVTSELRRLCTFLEVIHHLVMAFKIEPQDETTAYNLFEGLNNRGMPLSQADLIKNELIKSCAEAERDDVISNWSDAKDSMSSINVSGINMPELLHYSHLSRYPEDVKATKLLDFAKEKAQTIGRLAYMRNVRADAEAFEKLVNPSSSLGARAVLMLEHLRNILGTKLSYIALLAILRTYEHDRVALESHIQAVNSFSFRYVKVGGGEVAQFTKIMQKTAHLVEEGKKLAEVKSHLKKHSTDASFQEDFANGFRVTNAKTGYYVVSEIEQTRVTDSGITIKGHGAAQNLEHIMPKTPTATKWPDAKKKKDEDPENYNDYLWRIGNLLPLPEGINKSIGNASVELKHANPGSGKKDYKGTGYPSPKDVNKYFSTTSHDKWDFDSIDHRQKDIANKYILDAWPL